MSEPIDVTLAAALQRIDEVRDLTVHSNPETVLFLAVELANEAQKLADYIGQPDHDITCRVHGLVPGQAVGGCRLCDEGEVPDSHDDHRPEGWDLFRMQDVVDEI